MIFDPSHDERKALTKCVDPGAKAEHSQGKQISDKGNETYIAETAELRLGAKNSLLSMGRELLGYAREVHGQSVLLGALVAAIEVGAYDKVASDLERNSANRNTEGAQATTFPMSQSLADVADMLSKLIMECDNLTSYAQTYAKLNLELAESASECGLGLAKDRIDEYVRQNASRPIEEVKSDTRWLIDHFEQIMKDLGSHLDALVNFLDTINSNEHNFILQLLRCEPSWDWYASSELIGADQRARNQLLQRSLALRATIQDESPSSLINPVIKLREALLEHTRE